MIKSRSSKELLIESFMELATIKPIDKITVADIIENCGVSRKSFYNNFQDKYDLIRYIHEKDLSEINHQYAKKSVFLSCIKAIEYIKENLTLYRNLARTQGNDFHQIVYGYCNKSILENIFQGTNITELPFEEAHALSIFCHGYAYKLAEWISAPAQSMDAFALSKSVQMAWPIGLTKYLKPQALSAEYAASLLRNSSKFQTGLEE